MKKKTVFAYVNNIFLCDVLQAALDNNKTVNEIKRIIEAENADKIVTFKVKEFEED